MKALAYAFSAENPHALRNILLVAVTVAYLAVIVVLFLRLRHANQKMADRMKELNKQKQAEQAAKEAETAAQEEPLTSKLHTCRPRTEETHTGPKVS